MGSCSVSHSISGNSYSARQPDRVLNKHTASLHCGAYLADVVDLQWMGSSPCTKVVRIKWVASSKAVIMLHLKLSKRRLCALLWAMRQEFRTYCICTVASRVYSITVWPCVVQCKFLGHHVLLLHLCGLKAV